MSPSRRVLLRDGHEVPLIARYYDLLAAFDGALHKILGLFFKVGG